MSILDSFLMGVVATAGVVVTVVALAWLVRIVFLVIHWWEDRKNEEAG